MYIFILRILFGRPINPPGNSEDFCLRLRLFFTMATPANRMVTSRYWVVEGAEAEYPWNNFFNAQEVLASPQIFGETGANFVRIVRSNDEQDVRCTFEGPLRATKTRAKSAFIKSA